MKKMIIPILLVLCLLVSGCGKKRTSETTLPSSQSVIETEDLTTSLVNEASDTTGSSTSAEIKTDDDVSAPINTLDQSPAAPPASPDFGLSDETQPTASADKNENEHVHTPVVDPAVEATCMHTGLTEGSHCKECGEVLIPQQEIMVQPHRFEKGVCIWCGSIEQTTPSSYNYGDSELPIVVFGVND